MQLIIVSHRQEAKCFFENFSCKNVPQINGLFHAEKFHLMIVGEGLWDAFGNTMLALSYLQQQPNPITSIVNLGVVGALRLEQKTNDVFSVRTCYAMHRPHDPEFHSYTSSLKTDHLNSLDCLSYFQRVTTSAEKKIISPYAALLDRELWAIARASTLFDLPWCAIKVVSDSLEDEYACEKVQQQAFHFSQLLYDAWLPLTQTKGMPISTSDFSFTQHLHDNLFHLTFSQNHLLKDLIAKVLNQEQITAKALFQMLPMDHWQKLRPKEKTNQLLLWLRYRLTPHLKNLATPLEHWLRIWKKDSVEMQLSPAHEFEYLEVKFKSHSTEDWKNTLQYLQTIPREELENLLQGKPNV